MYLMLPLYVHICSTSSGIFFLTHMFTWTFLRVRSSFTTHRFLLDVYGYVQFLLVFIRDTSFTMIQPLFLPFLFGILCAISMSARVRLATSFTFSMDMTFLAGSIAVSEGFVSVMLDIFILFLLLYFSSSFSAFFCLSSLFLSSLGNVAEVFFPDSTYFVILSMFFLISSHSFSVLNSLLPSLLCW